MASTLAAIRLTDEDQQAIAILRQRYSLGGTSQTIRFALKVALEMQIQPRPLMQTADVFDLSKYDPKGIGVLNAGLPEVGRTCITPDRPADTTPAEVAAGLRPPSIFHVKPKGRGRK